MENIETELDTYYVDKVKNNLVREPKTVDIQPKTFDCEETTFANMHLKNKYVFANFTDAEFFNYGEAKRSFFDFYQNISKCDVGLICTGGVYGIYDLVGMHNAPVIFNDNKHKKLFADFTQSIHTTGTKIMLTLKPNFGRCNDNAKLFNILLGSASFNKNYYDSRVICGKLSDQRCNEIANRFKNISRFAKDCGFDGVLIDGGLDEVLGEFSSKEFNRRQLGYFTEIYDLPVKCVKSIINEVGSYPIIYKINLQAFLKDVYNDSLKNISTLKMVNKFTQTKQVVELLTKLISTGVDGFWVQFGARETEFLNEQNSLESAALFKDYINTLSNMLKELEVKNKFGETVKFIVDYDTFINTNKNDFLSDVTKDIYSDKEFIIKQKTQKLIKKCIKCNKCVDFKQKYNKIKCLVNPLLKDDVLDCVSKNFKENIAIVGAGISGLVCALTLASRGIKCDLFEQENVINKKGEICDVFGYDNYLKNYNDYLKCEILKNAKSNKIDLKLNSKFEYDSNLIKNYTTIIVATGSHEKFLNSNGAVQKHVKSIYDILSNKQYITQVDTIAIYAKSELSLKLALYLAKEKKRVSVIISNLDFMFDMPNANLTFYLNSLKTLRVDVYIMARLKKINEDSVEIFINNKIKHQDYVSVVLNLKSKKSYGYVAELNTIDAKLFIYEPELYPNNKLYYDLVKNHYKGKVYLIGDALQVGELYDDIRTGYYVGKNI